MEICGALCRAKLLFNDKDKEDYEMVYTEYDKLSILEIEEETESIAFDVLADVLAENPVAIIYIEKDSKLYGLISTGDIIRAQQNGKESVVINQKFTKLSSNGYMRAITIFKEKPQINALPVVDAENRLLGEWLRWNDSIELSQMDIDDNKFALDFLKKYYRIAMVKPCDKFTQKQKYFAEWRNSLERVGCKVDVIDRRRIPEYLGKVDFILFSDEDERRGTVTLFENIVGLKYDWRRALTYKEIGQISWDDRLDFDEVCKEEIGPSAHVVQQVGDVFGDIIGETFLKSIQEQGVHVFTIQFVDNGSECWKKFHQDVDARNKRAGVVPGKCAPEWYEEFFGEYYSEQYASEILEREQSMKSVNGMTLLKDCSSELYNVINNERKTVNQPKNYSQDVFFVGGCVVIGTYVEDKHTIASFLQQEINNEEFSARVSNMGSIGDVLSYLIRIGNLPLKKGDVLILYLKNRSFPQIPNINLADYLGKYDIPVTWVTNRLEHCNYRVNEIISEIIFEKIENVLQRKDDSRAEGELIKIDKTCLAIPYIEKWFNKFDYTRYGTIGSIVMNCNPFTKGHRYLIEQALQKVDLLIVFVVEEDRSVFPYAVRNACVRAGVSDIDNIMVVPSGGLILSQTTFPEYFMKIADEDIIQNVEYDISVFAEQIAPNLNIKYRFVGEEPVDGVTREYNEAMKRILPVNGIELVEIPRREINGEMISATKVRKYLDEGNWGEVDNLIPESTKRILCWKND